MRALRAIWLAGLLLATATVAAPAAADEIYFLSGDTLKGLVVEEHVDRLIVSTIDGEQIVWRQDIDQVFFDDPERNYLYLGNDALAGGDLNAAVALYQRSLQMNPAWPDARDALRRLEDRQRRLSRGAAGDAEGALQEAWGVTLMATENYPVISTLASGAWAATQGFQVHDAIVAVWGESMGYRPLAQVADRLLEPGGREAKVTLARDVAVSAPSGAAAWPGFEVALELDGLVVRNAGPWGTSAGLRAGDLLVGLNGQPTRYLPMGAAKGIIERARAAGLQARIHRHVMITRPATSS